MEQDSRAKATKMGTNRVVQLLGQWSNGSGALYRQLAAAFTLLIDEGTLRSGDQLPPERALASSLSVSRGTVVKAFELLEEDGRVSRVQGRGTTVNGVTVPSARNEPFVGERLWMAEGGALDLLKAIPRILPGTVELINEIDLSSYTDDLDGSEPLGWWRLRESIAQLHTSQGLQTSPHQIMVTTGAQQAIALIVNSMVQPGDVVLGEDDTWPGLIDAVRQRGARFEPVKMDHEGIIIADLEAKVDRFRPALIALNPQHQNPTGARLPIDRVRAVAEIALRYRIPVLEDRVAADLGFDRRHLPAIDEFDTGGYGITLGSICKIAWPGLRLGWVRADAQVINRVRSHKAMLDLFTPALSQLLGFEIIDRYDDFVVERLTDLRRSADVVLDWLERDFDGWSYLPPRGGYSVWVTLPGDVSADAFVQAAGLQGVLIASGRNFCPNDADCSNIRIPFTAEPEILDEALSRLSQTWRNFRALQAV